MDALTVPVEIAPTDPRVLPLIQTHLALMRELTPEQSVHAMDAGALEAGGARFFAIFDGGEAVAMGALRPLGPVNGETGHGEIKSMHVRERMRGQGLADAMLAHLLAVARQEGMGRVSLETGARPAFAPARAFYARHGFAACPPIEGYKDDPESVFMTMTLDPAA